MAVVARSESARGEITLLQRGDGAIELRVNGVFVMDDAETTSERLLATTTLQVLGRAATAGSEPRAALRWSVLVGGLGLGFTLAELLQDERVGRVLVAEIEAALVDWHRTGVVSPPTPSSPRLGSAGRGPLDDPRVSVSAADVRDVVADQRGGTLDAIVLDVDNGPGFLVYGGNASLYEDRFLASCAEALSPGGVVAVWSSDEAADLVVALRRNFHAVEQLAVPVTLGRRETTYHLLVASLASRDRDPTIDPSSATPGR